MKVKKVIILCYYKLQNNKADHQRTKYLHRYLERYFDFIGSKKKLSMLFMKKKNGNEKFYGGDKKIPPTIGEFF